jgi:hypothetical protein
LAGTPFALEGKQLLMERALASAGIAVVYQDHDLGIIYAENLPTHFESVPVPGGSDADMFGQAHGGTLEALKQKVLDAGTPASTEVDISIDGELRTYEIKVQRVSLGQQIGLLSIITEITETRHREKVLKSLLRELSHRSKNLLAIIQGIATQTARNTLSLDSFLVKFRGRLQSLSNSQDLITDSSWRGAFLFELTRKQFAPYWPESVGPERASDAECRRACRPRFARTDRQLRDLRRHRRRRPCGHTRLSGDDARRPQSHSRVVGRKPAKRQRDA